MFECDNCGECCKNISNSQELREFDRGDGVCKYLNLETNLCNIYENRPDICDVKKMYEKVYKTFYSKEQFYKLNYEACEILKEKSKMRR